MRLRLCSTRRARFVEFEYQTDVLGSALVDQMLAHYVGLLDNALAEPERRLTSMDMLGAGERDTVLAQSHGELVATPATTMVAMLEAAAGATPDAVALVSDDAELTYAELHRRANRLARWLIGQGFGADDIIGLRMTTSIEFIVAMLAVLKAGAAYLPIDPAYPDDRIEYLVTDARPQTVIGRDELDAAERAAAQHVGRRAHRRRPAIVHCIPSIWPMSSTLPAPPASPRAWRSRTARSPSTWMVSSPSGA